MKGTDLKDGVSVFLKGVIIGAANVVPGVSGGTFAVIFGILERIMVDIKSFNGTFLCLLIRRRYKEMAAHTDIIFLAELAAGMVVSIFSFANLLEFLFVRYQTFVWAFFFGLILVSVYYVGKRVSKWNVANAFLFFAGVVVAAGVGMLSPASQNASPVYLFVCGMLAITAMILPGISGSFILILLGNYELVVIRGVGGLHFAILVPFFMGCVVGLLMFSYALSYLMKKCRDKTVAVLAGFILGSLTVIWPWKRSVFCLNSLGEVIIKNGEPLVLKYERFMPETLNGEVLGAIAFALLGMMLMFVAEKMAESRS